MRFSRQRKAPVILTLPLTEMLAKVGSAIVRDRPRLHGNNCLCDRLRSAISDPRSSAIVCDHMETSLNTVAYVHFIFSLHVKAVCGTSCEIAGVHFLVCVCACCCCFYSEHLYRNTYQKIPDRLLAFQDLCMCFREGKVGIGCDSPGWREGNFKTKKLGNLKIDAGGPSNK